MVAPFEHEHAAVLTGAATVHDVNGAVCRLVNDLLTELPENLSVRVAPEVVAVGLLVKPIAGSRCRGAFAERFSRCGASGSTRRPIGLGERSRHRQNWSRNLTPFPPARRFAST